MKIVVLIPGFGIGGAQKQCIYLLNELQKDPDLELHLIYFYEGINFSTLNHERLQLHLISASSFYNPLNIAKILRVTRKIKPDILFSWLHSSDVYSYFVSRLTKRCKWVMTERDSHYPSELRYKLRNIAGKSADLIISNSEKGKLYWVKQGVNENKLKVIGNILIPVKTPDKLALEGAFVVTYAGRLEIQKNVISLTNAFCRLSEIYPDALFLIIGEGSLKENLAEIINTNCKNGNITLMPYQKNINEYFASTNVFINISAHEGLPNTIIENIHLGNKIVASRIPEHEAILGTAYPYFVDEIADIEQTVTAVQLILDEQEIVKHLDYGKQQLRSMSAEKIAAAYKDMFKRVCKE